MKHEYRPVIYCYECGDESLPHLKDLVSEKEDPMKSKILAYLRTNCNLACPGILEDKITHGKTIGAGNLFSDGTYFWNDAFINYVDRYNIPVPAEFRQHILTNYDSRMKRHAMLRLIDSVEIFNDVGKGIKFYVRIYKNGVIKYRAEEESSIYEKFTIDPEHAHYIINPIMKNLFCYDTDNHGNKNESGYHWKLVFYRGKDIADIIEGHMTEDVWRYKELLRNLEFAERFIPRSLGTTHMSKYIGESKYTGVELSTTEKEALEELIDRAYDNFYLKKGEAINCPKCNNPIIVEEIGSNTIMTCKCGYMDNILRGI